MSKGISIAWALILIGCGAPLEEDEAVETDSSIELGQIQQAETVLLPGYGVMGESKRCWAGTNGTNGKWLGGICYVPQSRTWRVVISPNTCTGPFAADYRIAMENAAKDHVADLRSVGWTADIVLAADPGTQTVHTVRCGSPLSGSGAAASTDKEHVPQETECSNISQGRLCRMNHYWTHVVQSRIETPTFVNAAVTSRRNSLYNTFRHELAHGTGLGHDLCGPDPLTQLMADPPCQSATPPWSKYKLLPFELEMLAFYHND